MPRTYVRRAGDRRPKEQRSSKVYVPQWIDPYFWIQGSSIEKMVMAELARRGIYFIFRNQTNTLGGFVDPSWEADFLIPQHKIWIEVQGSYFHSLPGQIETDAYRFAAIAAAGWRPIALWEFDILTRLNDILDAVPEFYMARRSAELKALEKYGESDDLGFKLGKNDDQLKGLRAALSKRRKPVQYLKRYRTKRNPK